MAELKIGLFRQKWSGVKGLKIASGTWFGSVFYVVCCTLTIIDQLLFWLPGGSDLSCC